MLTTGSVNGHRAVWLENDLLKISLLPDKGADIYEFIYIPGGVDFLMKTPAGLRPPGHQPPVDFLDNYEGGWQELLPNANDACDYRGVTIPFHGEVALLGWDLSVVRDDDSETAIRLSVRCGRTPLRLDRQMRLRAGTSSLDLVEAVTNESDEPADFVWGHHIVLGNNFLEDGCRLDAAARTLITSDQLYEPATARLAPGQCERWPLARGRTPDERIDLTHVPGPDAHAHDDLFLTGFEHGYLAVTNPRLKLRFSLGWDDTVFPYAAIWQPYGGADMPPLTGIYGLGIEPWVSRHNLCGAIEHGEAIRLGPRESITTSLTATAACLSST